MASAINSVKTSEQKRKTKDKAVALFLLGLFLMILALLSLENESTISNDTSDDTSDVRVIDLVNKHLRDAYDRGEIERKNAENINILTAPTIKNAPKTEPVYHFNELPLTFDQDSTNELLGKDLRLIMTQAVEKTTMSQQIQEEILSDMKRSADEESYRKALAEAIIKKAESQGYKIEIDENFKVTNMRKINQKEKQSIFDQESLPQKGASPQ